jgi:acyl-CoA synthetase (NDP forming)
VALAIDLVPEFDGDESYPLALQDVWASTDTPLALLSTMHSAMDPRQAARLRGHGIPVLEGARSGLVALSHLASYGAPVPDATRQPPAVSVDRDRQASWRRRLAHGPLDAITSFALLADYGLPVVESAAAGSADEAVAAARTIGGPVAMKTDEPGIAHKSDVGGVRLGLAGDDQVAAAYADLAERIGPRVVVSAMAGDGVELALGIVRDPLLGPLVLVAAGGVLVELLDDRVVALPPVAPAVARRAVDRLKVRRLLDGFRGAPAADVEALLSAVTALSALAMELGDAIDAVDVNPVVVRPDGLRAVDALVVPRPAAGADEQQA